MRNHTTIKVWTNTSNELNTTLNELTTTPNELTTQHEFTTKVIELREQTGDLFKIHKCSHTVLLLI